MSDSPQRHLPAHRPPVFVVGCMKSGTTLLLALLDGHPELLVMPSELNYFRYSAHPTRFPERKLAHETDLSELARRIAEGLHFLETQDPARLQLLRERFGHERLHDFSAIDPTRFLSALEDARFEDPPGLVLSLFRALLSALGRDPAELARLRPAEKSPLQEEHAPELKRWFPEAKFLHVVRNPGAVLCALRRVELGEYRPGVPPRYPRLRRNCQRLRASHEWALRNQHLFGDDYLVVRYEDLVLESVATMTKLAAFLGIAPRGELLEPTLLARPWSGNSMNGAEFAGIDTRPVHRWREELSPYEAAVVGRHFRREARRHGYAPCTVGSALGVLRRQPYESVGPFLANRLLLARPLGRR